MQRRLAMTVFVEGERYDAGSTPPAEVAEKITSPYAWEATDDDKADAGDKPAKAATPDADADAKADADADADAKARSKGTRRA